MTTKVAPLKIDLSGKDKNKLGEVKNTPTKSLEELLGESLTPDKLKKWYVKWSNIPKWSSPFEPFADINKEELDIDYYISTLDPNEVDYNEIVMLKKAFDIKRKDIVWVWANENGDKATIKQMLEETSIIKTQGIKHVLKYDSNEALEKHFYPNGRVSKKTEEV